ncbi:hypothetical protein Hanom_Chr10g00955141 [Helianthus anomalus]
MICIYKQSSNSTSNRVQLMIKIKIKLIREANFLMVSESSKWVTNEISHIGIHPAFESGKNHHLGPKPVNTPPNARQCG